jgi:CO dehydrogenase/acetyl-CoA synthase epsilon subunit
VALEYWLYGDIPPGPIKASVITDIKTALDVINRFRNRLMAIGSQISRLKDLTSQDLIEKILSIAQGLNAFIATSSTEVVKILNTKDVKSYEIVFPLELAKKVARSNFDIIMFIGYPYAYEWLILNYIKNYMPNVKTLSLEPYAQPNATWTLTSLPLQIWYKNICSLESMLKGGK